MQQTLSVPNDVAVELAGIGDGVLSSLRDRLRCTIHLRGNQLTIEGDEAHVDQARTVIDEIVELVEGGHEIGPSTVDAVLGVLDKGADVREVFDDVVWRHRGKKIAPKTVNQKRYVDAIRNQTVTFGIGPAGTGKTYLAMALAVAALQEREVSRIILTRPAVEAGERLGFLPGDILAKVDPSLRPLFDALYDMLDADKLNSYMERGIVEVAPLAFMRGRTLNDSFIILDEAQNTSPEQMQMFVRTSCGTSSSSGSSRPTSHMRRKPARSAGSRGDDRGRGGEPKRGRRRRGGGGGSCAASARRGGHRGGRARPRVRDPR